MIANKAGSATMPLQRCLCAQLQLPRCAEPILQDRVIIVGVVVVLDAREPEDPRAVQPPGQGRRTTPRPHWCIHAHLRVTMFWLSTLAIHQ